MAGTPRRRFDPEFRAGAVRIVKETGKPVSHVARDLGINEYTLHNWVQMDRHANGQAGGNGSGGGTLKESESEELARLRREKAELVLARIDPDLDSITRHHRTRPHHPLPQPHAPGHHRRAPARHRTGGTLTGLTDEIATLRAAVDAIAARVRQHEEQLRQLTTRTR